MSVQKSGPSKDRKRSKLPVITQEELWAEVDRVLGKTINILEKRPPGSFTSDEYATIKGIHTNTARKKCIEGVKSDKLEKFRVKQTDVRGYNVPLIVYRVIKK